jgi:cytochrome c553
MNKMMTYAVAGLLTMASAGVMAAGDPVAGKAKYAGVCVSCHGANGISNVPIYPNLAGQKEQYLVAAMKGYQNGTRTDATMKAMAAGLSETDINNIAAYLTSLSCGK